jgi:hypothetical protein
VSWPILMDWLKKNAEAVEAAATVALVIFASVQIGIENARSRARKRAAEVRLEGPAWLARRSLEAAFKAAEHQSNPREWWKAVGKKESLDALERHMLATLRVASGVGGKKADNVQDAFQRFLAFADRVNAMGTYEIPWRQVTTEEMVKLNGLARHAIKHLSGSITALALVVPRRPEEPPLPLPANVPLLADSSTPSAPRTLTDGSDD